MKLVVLATITGAFLGASTAAWVVTPACVRTSSSVRYDLGTALASSNDAAVSSSPINKQILPPSVVSERVFRQDKRPIILFDGVCNLCNNAVNLALDWDPEGNLRFAALQSNVGRALLEKNGRRADDISSIVLVTPDGAFVKSDAILKITEALMPRFLPTKQAARLAFVLVPKFLRDLVYDQVADNRYQLMGKRDECRFDADGEFEDRFVKDELAYDDGPVR